MTWDVRRGVRQPSRALCTRRIAHGFTSSRKPSTPRLTSLSRPLHRIPSQPWLAEHFWALSPAARRSLGDGWHRPGVSYWPDASDGMNEAVRRIRQRGEPIRPVLAPVDRGSVGVQAVNQMGPRGLPPGVETGPVEVHVVQIRRPGRAGRAHNAQLGAAGHRSSRLAAARPRGRCAPEAAELSMQLLQAGAMPVQVVPCQNSVPSSIFSSSSSDIIVSASGTTGASVAATR
jgi:hypothetical protein